MPDEAILSADDALEVVAALREARVDAWVAGGWAVDALVGEQTREHRDLDLAIRAEHLAAAIATLEAIGYGRARDLLPVRIVLTSRDDRSIDCHPVTFDESGHGRQPGDDGRVFDYPPDAFGLGMIAGVEVPCLSAVQLVRFHLGYEPQEHDRRDMALLRDRMGVDLPPPY